MKLTIDEVFKYVTMKLRGKAHSWVIDFDTVEHDTAFWNGYKQATADMETFKQQAITDISENIRLYTEWKSNQETK